MRKLIIIIALLLSAIAGHAQSTLLAGVQNRAVDYKSWGAWGTVENMYIYLPWDYYTSGKDYPIIIFYHGQGEVGNGGDDLDKLLNADGIPKLINQGKPPYSIDENGDTTRFIVVSPQVFTAYFSPQFTAGVWNSIEHYNLNIDQNRIYLTGLSLGGEGAQNAVQAPSTVGFTAAAAVIMSPAHVISEANASYYENVPAWFFQGDNDGTVGQTGTNGYNLVHGDYPTKPFKLTQYSGGHCCWATYYDPTWNDNQTTRNTPQTDNISIYDYMMRYSLGGTPPTNVHPVAHAGSDQALDPGTTSATLTGSGTDSDGSIVSYAWAKVGTNGATITSPSSATTTIAGLTDGNTYTFQLTVTDNDGATGSDQVAVTVGEEEHPADTPIYKIPLSATTVIWKVDTPFFQLNDLTGSPRGAYLMDEQGADPLHGVDTPTPTTAFWSGFAQSLYYPTVAVIDLGAVYKLTNEYYYKSFPSGIMYIQTGSPNNWSADTMASTIGGSGWNDIADTVYTRYLKVFYSATGTQKVYELILYGHIAQADSLSRTPTDFNPDTSYSVMSKFVGFNDYGDVPFEIREGLGNQRQYSNISYLDTVTATHDVNDVNFVFSKFTENQSTVYYNFPEENSPEDSWQSLASDSLAMFEDVKYWKNKGAMMFYATQGINQFNINYGYNKAIDPIAHPSLDTTAPASYDRLARLAWTMGAIFGKNHYASDSIQSNYPSNQYSGSGYLKYLEAGNEINGTWLPKTQYYSPQEMIAYLSAYYDGDDGLMGTRFGVKKADSTIQVVFPGDAADNRTSYMMAMRYWAQYNRPDKRIPFDIYNFHDYAYSKVTNLAISPENYHLREYLQNIVDSAHLMCESCKVWETEWGYDRNRTSPLGVPIIEGKDSAQIQAEWTSRYWLISSFVKGLTRSFIFQIRNDALTTKYDSVGHTKFNTSGLTDGHFYSPNHHNYFAFPSYYMQRTIYSRLHDYKPDSIIYENYDSIWVYRYRNVNHPDSVVYAFWSGTQTNRTISNISIQTGHATTDVNIIELKDKYMNGLSYTPTTASDGSTPVVINETPKLLFTTEGQGGGQLISTPDNTIHKALLYLLDNGKIVIINSQK